MHEGRKRAVCASGSRQNQARSFSLFTGWDLLTLCYLWNRKNAQNQGIFCLHRNPKSFLLLNLHFHVSKCAIHVPQQNANNLWLQHVLCCVQNHPNLCNFHCHCLMKMRASETKSCCGCIQMCFRQGRSWTHNGYFLPLSLPIEYARGHKRNSLTACQSSSVTCLCLCFCDALGGELFSWHW